MTTPLVHAIGVEARTSPGWGRERSGVRILGAIALVVAIAGRACANVGPPSSGGQLVAEPQGVASVSITQETLSIDLRPLADDQSVQVEAVYELSNPLDRQTVELAFASGAPGVSSFRVWLDEQPVGSQPRPEMTVPPSWQPPPETPGINGRALDYLSHQRGEVTPFVFTLTLPPGPSRLTVRYSAEATRYHVGEPTVVRQFGYALAPAAAWKSFGGLQLEVWLPAGWLAAVTPSLDREGDVLRGRFEHLPEDAVALTVQAPTPPAYRVVWFGGLALLAACGVGGGVGCWRAGVAMGRRQAVAGGRSWPRAVVLAVLWAAGFFLLGVAAIFGPDLTLPRGQVSLYGYGKAFALFGVILLTGLIAAVGFLVTQIAAIVPRRDRRMSPASDA